jgi:translation initiation factor IF-1
MSTNTKGGKGFKKGAKKNRSYQRGATKGSIDVDSGTDFYASVVKRNGTNQIVVKLHDGREVIATFGGKFRKKAWFNPKDTVHIKQDVVTGVYEIQGKIFSTHSNAIDAGDRLDIVEEDTRGIIFKDAADESDDDENLDEKLDQEYGKISNTLSRADRTRDNKQNARDRTRRMADERALAEARVMATTAEDYADMEINIDDI